MQGRSGGAYTSHGCSLQSICRQCGYRRLPALPACPAYQHPFIFALPVHTAPGSVGLGKAERERERVDKSVSISLALTRFFWLDSLSLSRSHSLCALCGSLTLPGWLCRDVRCERKAERGRQSTRELANSRRTSCCSAAGRGGAGRGGRIGGVQSRASYIAMRSHSPMTLNTKHETTPQF